MSAEHSERGALVVFGNGGASLHLISSSHCEPLGERFSELQLTEIFR